MAALADLYIKVETIETILATLRQRQEQGISLTISIQDQSDKYGQNVSASVSQSKEDREAKKKKFYVGNGKVFWHDNKIVKGVKPEPEIASDPNIPFETIMKSGELPF